MKRVSFSVLLAAVLCLMGTKAQAYDLAIENEGVTIYYNYINNGTELEVTRNYKYNGDVAIPEEVTYENNILRVTSIGWGAFNECSSLTSVTIPNSVTSIGSNAFSDCSSLTSVTIPNSVTSIGSNAFYHCSSLTSVTIPNSVTSIGSNAFANCSSLTSVTIGSGVTSIGSNAFYYCSSLTSVTIPNSVTSIEKETFYNCSALTSVTIGDGVTSIGNDAFDYCSNLTSITIGKNVTSIGILPFSGCNSLSSVYISDLDTWCKITFFNQESNPLYFAHHLFLNGEEIQELVIPNSVTSIGNYAFIGCSSLTSVTIPNSVTSIGNAAFGECSGLTSVSIPSSVTSIGDNNFAGCTGLTSVSIPNSVTSIGMNAFGSCTGLTSITIPNSVTSIGQWAFRNCSSLTSVTIGSGVTSIGWGPFDGCDIPEVISKIEEPFAIDEYTFTTNTFNNATLYVPAESLDKYKATNGWKRFVLMEGVCATPTISFVNGEVVFACETEGVEFVPTVTCVPQQLSGNKLKLGSTFTVSVYATKEGCLDSDVATMTIDASSVGDVNGDGEVNVSDVTALVSIILGQ